MFSTKTEIRVRYGETDKMGYVYYGNYALYYEVARTELMRSLGIVYAQLEQEGILMPVTQLVINYKRPAFYDDMLTIITTVKKIPSATIEFHYETYNNQEVLLNDGLVSLAFIDAQKNRPTRAPSLLIDKLSDFF